MKVAVTYKDGEVFQHFGHTEQFKVYEIEGKEIKSSEVIDTNGSGHESLAGFLKDRGIMTLICGGIGAGAKKALAAAGITLYPGTSGKADEKVREMLDGTLQYNLDIVCSHHDGQHHDGAHQCGNHHE
ncbi:MAG: dinitrogenase iron-molybdenum cofactor biosynthesis protein [Clostridiales bacterium]|nr:dinitrogenase iron-molybdenum cofactor biosynthesis protein [Clostridiales bacterium]